MLYIFIVYVVLCVIEKIEGYVTLNMNYVIFDLTMLFEFVSIECFCFKVIGYLSFAR